MTSDIGGTSLCYIKQIAINENPNCLSRWFSEDSFWAAHTNEIQISKIGHIDIIIPFSTLPSVKAAFKSRRTHPASVPQTAHTQSLSRHPPSALGSI